MIQKLMKKMTNEHKKDAVIAAVTAVDKKLTTNKFEMNLTIPSFEQV